MPKRSKSSISLNKMNTNYELKSIARPSLTNAYQENEESSTDQSKLHPFISVKNKEANFFDEYKSSEKFIKSPNEFKEAFLKAFDTKDCKDIQDFFCWAFSSSSNLIELLVLDRQSKSGKNSSLNEDKQTNYDPCYFKSINWKFMKDIYVNLNRLVNYYFFQIFTFQT
jgi:hypothetical protein